MRVIAGTARRMQLVTPDGYDTRPTQDIIKETLVNIIQFDVPGCVFADLCAGSGSIGIEALSRGASKAYFAENNRNAIRCIQENLHKTHFEDKGVLLKMDVLNSLRQIHEKHVDIIYLDPPYESTLVRDTLEQLAQMPYVDEDTMIIAETSLEGDVEFVSAYGFEIYKEKDYHSQRHLFIRKSGS